MNYYEAREIRDKDGQPTGRWHFTSANRRAGTHPVGYCSDHEGHESAEEAQACFHRYQLDGAVERSIASDTQRRCQAEGCENWTQKALELRHGGMHMLCDDHRNRDTLAALTEPAAQIVSSF